MTELLRKMSIAKGIIEPVEECKVTPNQHEIELAARPHRWKKMRELQKRFFNAFMAEVTEKEIELLGILRLPDIDTVRRLELRDEEESGGTFRVTPSQIRAVEDVLNDWREEILGADLAKQVGATEAIYPFHMLEAFALASDKYMQDIIREFDASPEEIERRRVRASLDNPYLRRMILAGGQRIRTDLGKKYINEVVAALKRMAKEGQNPFVVGRWLHKNIGEGKSWYWNRLARSESALAANAAFNANGYTYGVKYEEWSAAPGCCEICAYFDGKQWPFGEGPEPVTDTHPHCLCVLRHIYIPSDSVQDRWTRQSPYERAYTREERDWFAENS